jgi:hypothetical protein
MADGGGPASLIWPNYRTNCSISFPYVISTSVASAYANSATSVVRRVAMQIGAHV